MLFCILARRLTSFLTIRSYQPDRDSGLLDLIGHAAEIGIVNGQLSYTTAVGVMKSVVSVILVVSSNKIAHALGEEGLY